MDKNIAAILRDDTRTCMVAFQSTKDPSGWNTATTYMYVTTTRWRVATLWWCLHGNT